MNDKKDKVETKTRMKKYNQIKENRRNYQMVKFMHTKKKLSKS